MVRRRESGAPRRSRSRWDSRSPDAAARRAHRPHKDNVLLIRHDDGTVALYGHFTSLGMAVDSGAAVQAGATVGYSGNTGNTGGRPHLHFSVHGCNPVARGSAACPTVPVAFRNTDPNRRGLERDRTYGAR